MRTADIIPLTSRAASGPPTRTDARLDAATPPAGEFIRQQRERRGFSLAELAAQMGRPAMWLSRLERSETCMTLYVFQELCRHLGIGSAPPAKPRIRVKAPSRQVQPGRAIQIDRGIPAPAPPQPRRWPFAEMQIGDSFFAPGFTSHTFGSRIWYASAKTGFKFTMRQENGGVRVWRVV